jgi:hypothetical protein
MPCLYIFTIVANLDFEGFVEAHSYSYRTNFSASKMAYRHEAAKEFQQLRAAL